MGKMAEILAYKKLIDDKTKLLWAILDENNITQDYIKAFDELSSLCNELKKRKYEYLKEY